MRNLLYLLLVGFLFSCGGAGESDEPNPEEPDVNGEPKEYIVSLGMVGEIEISESPLGRATTSDLYGIQVYSKTATTEYIPYAYGLFDDKFQMTIKLLEGYQYKFVATMVVDGKNKINIDNVNNFDLPFFNGELVTLGNVFVISNTISMENIGYGTSGLLGYNDANRYFKIPNTDRYYGETIDYTPNENGKININMKRVVFGAKFIAKGLTEGRLKINIKEAPELNIVHGESTEIENIFTFSHNDPYLGDWTADNYSEIIPVSVSWEKADGAVVPLINQDITFKRKILSTITIKVKDTSINNGVEINQEAGDLISGDDITLESGTGIDKLVDPNI